MSRKDIRRSRSEFWVTVCDNNDDDGSYGILTNEYSLAIIQHCCPDLENMSPKEWKVTKNDTRHLWIPSNRAIDKEIQAFIQWAEGANEHIWLGTNRNITDYFCDELSLCVASDWNIDFETHNRTEVGEAEYNIKYRYPRGEISEAQADGYAETLSYAIMKCIEYLPLGDVASLLVTSIPATPNKLNSLSWEMARYVCEEIGATLLCATLKTAKQQTKGLSISEKIDMWNKIFANNGVSLSEKVRRKKVLIVDDLYQSGTSMWSFAKYLKALGAADVLGLVAVKSQRDSDNQ
jgi:hypothetical protein